VCDGSDLNLDWGRENQFINFDRFKSNDRNKVYRDIAITQIRITLSHKSHTRIS
jgi:hypothetical protein